MTWIRKMRVALFVVGLALCVAMLIGARNLTGGSAPDAHPKAAEAPHAQGGPVVMGTVDTDPPPVAYGLPPVLQSGSVKDVFVKDGDEVKADQKLYSFDDTIQRADLERAKAAVAYAQTKVAEARELAGQHAEQVKVMEQAVAAARQAELQRAAYYHLVEENLEAYFKAEKIPEAEWPGRKKRDANLYKANVEYVVAENERKLKEAELHRLKAVDPQVKVKEAEAAVKQAEAEQAKAQDAVDLCVVKAQMPGVVEQVTIGKGTTLGVATRTPALWLVPAGPRVVRAEVEAEFAHRIGPDRIGREVTITDHTDTKLAYKGVVRRISNTFLLKRANAENFLNGDTRVIEVVVEVKNPSPKDMPPLRVGQRVRVDLGQ